MATMKLMRSKKVSQFFLLLPALIPVVTFSLFPLLRGIYLGFTDYAFGWDISFNGLDNYRYMLTDTYFWQSFRVGFIWTIIVTAGQVGLGLGLAMLLNAKLYFRSVARVLVLVPWAMPPVIRGIMWRLMYHPDTGAVNHLFLRLGIIDQPINWLNSFQFAIPAVIIVGIWGGLPQASIALLAGLQAVPNELYEAASLDGAGVNQQFCNVTLPMIKPVMTAIISLNFMWNFNSFGLVWVLTQGGPGGLTRLPMLAAYEEAFRYGNVGYAAALGNVMVLFISIIMFVYLRQQFKERN